MNNTDSFHQQEFVPEVDAASLQGVALPPAPPPLPPEQDVPPATRQVPALPDEPEQAMQQLPPALEAHIQELIAQAEAEGYLRGRNEAIEATQHFDTPDDSEITPAPIPRYDRLTIWDL